MDCNVERWRSIDDLDDWQLKLSCYRMQTDLTDNHTDDEDIPLAQNSKKKN